ncbi:MAG TPA: peroxide stress protein YaaA [Lentimicrobium sp.]|nr:peroxide stress protein YaaA [Lentimicrobium sp.]
MIVLLSPSKTLDFKTPTHIKYGDFPLFIKDSEKLIRILRKQRIVDLMDLMGISYKLAELNYTRFKAWTYPYIDESRPAFAAFMGDVYEGLKAWELDSTKIEIADKCVRILSGLYGLLKPTDLILPYRLEMGITLSGNNFNNLYEFWDNKLTKQIAKEIKASDKKVVINLASAEYSKVIDLKKIKAKVITPFFMEFRNGTFKFITLNGKKARGLMTRFILDKNIGNVEEIKLFDYEGYSFSDELSENSRWVFVR